MTEFNDHPVIKRLRRYLAEEEAKLTPAERLMHRWHVNVMTQLMLYGNVTIAITKGETMQLGDKVKDTITGFEGVITGQCQYLTGCEQSLVQPPVKSFDASNDFVTPLWFDDDRLELVEAGVAKVKVTNAGSDIPAPVK